MPELPIKGTFKIQTVGPEKSIPNKKDPNRPWKSWGLQFEGDPQWYDTFWVSPDKPVEGQELTGTKSYDEQWSTYKFEIERQGGKSNWNPAGAQATVMLAAVEIVNGFLRLGNHYEMWDKGDVALKARFEKYVATVSAAAGQIREKVISMGALQPQEKVAEKKSEGTGDPGPTPPPDIEGWPEGQGPPAGETPQDV